MAHYPNVETYLNEEVRRPIKHYLNGVDEYKSKKVMEFVDYLCDKYRELNAAGKLYEDFDMIDKSKYPTVPEIACYIAEKAKPIDYDNLDCPYTDEELEYRESMLDKSSPDD